MVHAVRQRVKVQPDGSIQVYVPEFKVGTLAEVIILETSDQVFANTLSGIIGKGKGCFKNAEEADAFILRERSSWE